MLDTCKRTILALVLSLALPVALPVALMVAIGSPGTLAAPDEAAIALPVAANELLYAEHFTVDESFPFSWSRERPAVSNGTVVVVRVDPSLIRPRQIAEPVLFVGDQSAWRVSPYNEGGIVVAFVPGHIDLGQAPVWVGTPELPERIGRLDAARGLEAARAAGVRPFGQAQIERALSRDVEPAAFVDRTALLNGLLGITERYVSR